MTDAIPEIADLERRYRENPGSDAFVEYARALLDGGHKRAAYDVLKHGLSLLPEHIDGRLLLGEVLFARRKYQACTREMARLLSTNATCVAAMKLLGRALVGAGQIEEAWVILRRARKTAPDDIEARALEKDAAANIRSSKINRTFDEGGRTPTLRPEARDDRASLSISGPIPNPIAPNPIAPNPIAPNPIAPTARPKAFTDYIRSVASTGDALREAAAARDAGPSTDLASSEESPTHALEPEYATHVLEIDPMGQPRPRPLVSLSLEGPSVFDRATAPEVDPPRFQSIGESSAETPHSDFDDALEDSDDDPTRAMTDWSPPDADDGRFRPEDGLVESAEAEAPIDTEAQSHRAQPHQAQPHRTEPALGGEPPSDTLPPTAITEHRTDPQRRSDVGDQTSAPRKLGPWSARPPTVPAVEDADDELALADDSAQLDADWDDDAIFTSSLAPATPPALADAAVGSAIEHSDRKDRDATRDTPRSAVVDGLKASASGRSKRGLAPTHMLDAFDDAVDDLVPTTGLDIGQADTTDSSPPSGGAAMAPGADTADSSPALPPSRRVVGAVPDADDDSDESMDTDSGSDGAARGPHTVHLPRRRRRVAGSEDQPSGAGGASDNGPSPALADLLAVPADALSIGAGDGEARRDGRLATESPAAEGEAASGGRDLLDIPFDPAEFAHMPPKPAGIAAHSIPDDLDRLESDPAIVGRRPFGAGSAAAAGTGGPPRRIASVDGADDELGAGRLMADEPVGNVSPAAPRRLRHGQDLDNARRKLSHKAPVPAGAPARRGAQMSANSVVSEPLAVDRGPPAVPPLPTPMPPPQPDPKPVAKGGSKPPPEGAADAPNMPNYHDDFASYFDAKASKAVPLPDALGDMVEVQRVGAQQVGVVRESDRVSAGVDASQLTPFSRPDPEVSAVDRTTPDGRLARFVLVIAMALALVGSAAATWRYRSEVGSRDVALREVERSLADGNFGSRVRGIERIAAVNTPPDPLARATTAVVELLGGDGLAARRRALIALDARIRGELVAIFGERAQLESALEAQRAAATEAAGALDTALAAGLLALARAAYDEARVGLAAAADAYPSSADAQYLLGRIALLTGRREEALDRFRTAVSNDPGFIWGHTAIGDFRASRGDYSAALDTYRDVLDTLNADHVDTRIAHSRLQIRLRKQEEQALATLQELLGGSDVPLSQAQSARAHDTIGVQYLTIGNLGEARRAFDEAVKAAPDDPRFSAGLARLDIREFKLDAAEARLLRALEVDPAGDAHRVSLTRVFLLRGDAKDALAQLDRIGEPTAESLLLRGRAHLELGDARGAEEALAEARRRDKGSLDIVIYRTLAALLLGRAGIALRDLEKMRTGQNSRERRLEDKTLPFRAYAKALAHQNDLRKAAEELDRAVAVDPRDFRAHEQRCRILMAQRRGKAALAACRSALETNPAYFPAAALSAEIAEARLDHGGVVAALAPFVGRRALPPAELRRHARALVARGELDAAAILATAEPPPEASTIRYIEGLVATARGELGDALRLLAAAADELAHEPHVQIAYADALMKADKPDRAGGFYRRAIEAGAGPEAGLGAARAWLARGRRNDALKSAREAERNARRGLSHPRLRAESLELQGRIWLESGTNRGAKKAAALLEAAQRAEPDLPAVIISLGRVAEMKGDAEGAAQLFERATRVAPNDPEGWFRFGRLLDSQRRTRREGQAALQRAVDLDPGGRWGALARRQLTSR